MNSKLWWLLPAALISSPAHAVLGFGDLTFDASTYGAVGQVVTQGKKLWDTTKKQLTSLDEIQRTLKDANAGVEALRNINLKKVASDLVPGSDPTNKDRINVLRSQMNSVESGVNGDTNYAKYQLQRIKNLETLQALQAESAKNLDAASNASKKSCTACDTKITAQSTAALAALAATEQQRKQEQDIAAAEDARRQHDSFSQSSSLYDAIGKEK